MTNNLEKKITSSPEYIFETSWEVCNKVGGIHTVIATKALRISEKYKEKYILIGPDFGSDKENKEFTETPKIFQPWQTKAKKEGLKVRVGYWNIPGKPVVILVDFRHYVENKDHILRFFWETYGIDSLGSSWDYVEAMLFGYASGRVIESFVNFNIPVRKSVVCHFHEWLVGSGLLYLKNNLPKVGTVFTTHATVIGRSIAGNSLPLYNHMKEYNADEMAFQLGVQHKHFLEKKTAHCADCFTTVSNITAQECFQFLNKKVDLITPNGFENTFVPNNETFDERRQKARLVLHKITETLVGHSIDNQTKMIATSGRYEFRNKGIDAYIDALGALNRNEKNEKELIAFIFIPTAHQSPNQKFLHNVDKSKEIETNVSNCLTHYLTNYENDLIIKRLHNQQLYNRKNDKVKVVFCPCYLDGNDGVFGLSYYDLLIGLDATVFASYYEPWGYTPLESLAFSVPTITTSLSGFGVWVREYYPSQQEAIQIIERNDTNYGEVVGQINKNIIEILSTNNTDFQNIKKEAQKIAQVALWENLNKYYFKCYVLTINNIAERLKTIPNIDTSTYIEQFKKVDTPNWRSMIVHRSIPKALTPLEEISKNLWWCWNDDASELFRSIDEDKWYNTDKNPIALLDSISLTRYKELEKDSNFILKMNQVYNKFKNYMATKDQMASPSVAYFSMEYGLHSSLKIYSGGLGILAGDYLKEASDKALKIIGIGLLYRYGYFTQKLSSAGNQEADYEAQDFSKIPVTPVIDENGKWITISVDFPQRTLYARLWRVDVGRIELYLLDTDYEDNASYDRTITHHLYGGDWENRLKQEMLLGIGGIKALDKLGIRADVYHCNEGHAAFIGIERLAQYIQNNNLSFSEAIELVRASSLFTTHTPVPAGHDFFEEEMLQKYLGMYADTLRVKWQQILSLGKIDSLNPNEKFSMSNLAANLSQEVNGVSWLHGQVSKEIFSNLWPGYLPEELHISYVTNGVHQPTWTSKLWKEIQNEAFGENFKTHHYDPKSFEGIYNISDKRIWEVKSELRKKLICHIEKKLKSEKNTPYFSPKQLITIKENLRHDILTIGFARRFATYKRAHLLFSNIERLDKIVNNPKHPVQFIFAGKAHPADKAGQDLIKNIVEISKLPQFLGKVIFIPNYDMELARYMIQGVDVWMNTPTRPQEASGTSGEKAVMNGVMHFSVLDGWWVEGYREDAGWALPMEKSYENQTYQNEMDAELIYNIIEDEMAPAFYEKDIYGISEKWCNYIKNTIAKVAPNFTTNRMLNDYEKQFYKPMAHRFADLKENQYKKAIKIANWKRKVSQQWNYIKLIDLSLPNQTSQVISVGDTYKSEITLDIGELNIDDVGVELVVIETKENQPKILIKKEYKAISQKENQALFRLDITSEYPGALNFAIRVFPKNILLPHRQDFALIKWF